MLAECSLPGTQRCMKQLPASSRLREEQASTLWALCEGPQGHERSHLDPVLKSKVSSGWQASRWERIRKCVFGAYESLKVNQSGEWSLEREARWDLREPGDSSLNGSLAHLVQTGAKGRLEHLCEEHHSGPDAPGTSCVKKLIDVQHWTQCLSQTVNICHSR